MTPAVRTTRIAHVDLTRQDVACKAIPEEWARKYIGARGLGVRYLLENGPTIEPLSPDNMLCFLNGPLTGTAANMSGRMAIVTKSPLTGTVTDSHHGGWSAARLRWAGFDGLVFTGKADKPVYLYVEDEKAELRDASDLWGLGIHDTIKRLQARYGEKDLSVISIGQAGERLVRFGAWVNENDRASGRGGTGAVGGSKNLKAVVIKSTRKLPAPSDEAAFDVARRKALKDIMDKGNITAPKHGGLSVYGTNVLMNMCNTLGALGTNNSQATTFEHAELIGGEYVKEHILIHDPTCHACPVACKKEVEVTTGPYKGLRMESIEYEPAWSVGANCGVDDINTVAKIIDQANDLGFDAIEIGHCLSVLMEATQKGLVEAKDALAWGDTAAMVALVDKIGLREGIGDRLAEGPSRFAQALGHPELAMTVKGQGVAAYDPRGMKGMGLGYATSNRGACHVRAYTAASELGLVGALTTDPLAWKGKGKLTMIFQDLHAFSDSLDLCKFSSFAEGAADYAAQYSAMIGVPFTQDDVMHAGERIYNLERLFNNLAGFGEGSDYLPARYLNEPSTTGGSVGQVCELPQMLEEYYAERGWHNGVVGADKLRELDIEYELETHSLPAAA